MTSDLGVKSSAELPSGVSPYVLNGWYTSNGISVKIIELLPKVKNNLVITMIVPLLQHLLEEDVWGYEENDIRVELAPSNVIATNQPPEHYERILNADLSYPILAYFDKSGSMHVIDGMHRLAKAVIQEINHIPVKFVDLTQLN
jgi:hypothetical protein